MIDVKQPYGSLGVTRVIKTQNLLGEGTSYIPRMIKVILWPGPKSTPPRDDGRFTPRGRLSGTDRIDLNCPRKLTTFSPLGAFIPGIRLSAGGALDTIKKLRNIRIAVVRYDMYDRTTPYLQHSMGLYDRV